jgi:hypothetical protein
MDVGTVAATASTALVGAMATDAWERAVQGVTELWRRVHPHPNRAEVIGEELAETRQLILHARRERREEQALRGLEAEWQSRLDRLLRANPEMISELQRLVNNELQAAAGNPRVTMRATANGNSTLNMAGRDQNITYGP